MINKLKQQKLEEFDKKFPLGGEIWVLERHKKEVRDYLSSLIDKVAESTTQSLLEELEKEIITYHKKQLGKTDYVAVVENYSNMVHNKAIKAAISIIKKHMGDE